MPFGLSGTEQVHGEPYEIPGMTVSLNQVLGRGRFPRMCFVMFVHEAKVGKYKKMKGVCAGRKFIYDVKLRAPFRRVIRYYSKEGGVFSFPLFAASNDSFSVFVVC